MFYVPIIRNIPLFEIIFFSFKNKKQHKQAKSTYLFDRGFPEMLDKKYRSNFQVTFNSNSMMQRQRSVLMQKMYFTKTVRGDEERSKIIEELFRSIEL